MPTIRDIELPYLYVGSRLLSCLFYFFRTGPPRPTRADLILRSRLAPTCGCASRLADLSQLVGYRRLPINRVKTGTLYTCMVFISLPPLATRRALALEIPTNDESLAAICSYHILVVCVFLSPPPPFSTARRTSILEAPTSSEFLAVIFS